MLFYENKTSDGAFIFVVDDRMSFSSVGTWFHARGAATENARSPMCSVESWHFRWPWVTFEGHFGAADARSVCDCCVSCYLNVLTESCGWPASQQVRRTQDVSLLAVHMRRWIRLSRTAGMYSFPFPITFKLISINKTDFYRTGPDLSCSSFYF